MLKSFLFQLIRAAWRARVTLFWPIWITSTAAAAISVAWVVNRAASSTLRAGNTASLIRAPRYVSSRRAILAVTILCLFLVCYIGVALTWEDFAYSDNSLF